MIEAPPDATPAVLVSASDGSRRPSGDGSIRLAPTTAAAPHDRSGAERDAEPAEPLSLPQWVLRAVPLCWLLWTLYNESSVARLIDLPAWSFLPLEALSFYVDRCEFVLRVPTDQLTWAAWLLAALAALATFVSPRAGSALAAAGLAFVVAAAGIHGSSWFESAITGSAGGPVGCSLSETPDAKQLAQVVDQRLYERAVNPAVPILGTLLWIAALDGVAHVRGTAVAERWRWARVTVAAAIATVTFVLTGLPEGAVRELEQHVIDSPTLPLRGPISFLFWASLLALVPFPPTRSLGLRSAETAIGLAFGQWVFLLQAMHVHTHVLDAETPPPDLSYTTNIPDRDLSALDLAADYYREVMIVMVCLMAASWLLRILLLRRAETAAASDDTESGTALPWTS